MTNALIQSLAATAATGQRVSRLARHGVAVCLLAVAGIAAAQPGYSGRRDEVQNQAPVRVERGERERVVVPPIEQPRDPRQYDNPPRDPRVFDEARRQPQQVQQQDGSQREGGRRGRLTPDQRRDLRRQINEAGMDIYPNAQRR